MWDAINTILRSVTAFLEYGKAPPGASDKLKQVLEDENHLASKKFFVIFTSFITLIFFFFICVGILFLVPRDSVIIGGYVTIFTKVMEVFAIIIATYLGVQAAVDLRYSSSSSVSMNTETDNNSSSFDENENITENLTKNAKEPDYNITEINN
jgi:uncharacterized membrane protein YgcG